MRYKPEQKQATRTLLLSEATPLVKCQGFASTGLDTLMKAADPTTGAFYSQPSNKMELLKAILQHELSAQHDAFPLGSLEQLAGTARLHLSRGHAQHADMGCLIPALAAEVGRAGPEVWETFERALEQRQRQLAELMGDENRAWVLTCLSVDAVLLARAQADEMARDKVLDAALGHALGLLSANGTVSPRANRDWLHNCNVRRLASGFPSDK